MLRQTRVETVLPYYERFVARFPAVRGMSPRQTDACPLAAARRKALVLL